MKIWSFYFRDTFYDKLSLFIAILLDRATYMREKLMKYSESSYQNLEHIKIVLNFLNYTLHPVFYIIIQKLLLLLLFISDIGEEYNYKLMRRSLSLWID